MSKVKTVTSGRGARDDVLLVVGDWFVDEYWVCGIHRSSTSSRTGDAHLRALHPLRSDVHAFCGAGRSAFFLQQLYRHQAAGSRPIVGLGFWHRDDTDALQSHFQLGDSARNPYRLTPAKHATGANSV